MLPVDSRPHLSLCVDLLISFTQGRGIDMGVQGAGSDPVEESGVMCDVIVGMAVMTWADGDGG